MTGRTALMAAMRAGSVALVRRFLQKGGNPNTADRMGVHSAHIAAAKGLLEVRQGHYLCITLYNRYNITTVIISRHVIVAS